MKKSFVAPLAIFVGFTLIISAIMMQGNILSFWSVSSLVITLFGSFCALMVSYPMKQLMGIPRILKQMLIAPPDDREDLIGVFADLSKTARREGLLSLEDKMDNVEDNFLKKGLQMAVDGIEPETIREILELEIDSTERRHKVGQSIFFSWGELAPAFGMIGTLIGLIVMLSDLQDPSSIGVGMGTALITTFYGALFSNLVLNPITNNLKSKTDDELFTRDMMIEGIIAIQAGVNPRIVEEKLMTYLSPEEKLKAKKESVMGNE